MSSADSSPGTYLGSLAAGTIDSSEMPATIRNDARNERSRAASLMATDFDLLGRRRGRTEHVPQLVVGHEVDVVEEGLDPGLGRQLGPAEGRGDEVEALMLDFYGTVVHEDGPVIAGICERAAASVGHAVVVDWVARLWATAFAAECGGSFGATFKSQRAARRDSLARVLAEVGSPEDPDVLCSSQFAYWQRPRLYDDAKDFLAWVDLPVCIVSNIDRADLEQAMDHHGIAVDLVITSEDARSYKPRPELFVRALEILGVGPGAALHAGDSWSSDVVGANRLGIPVAWVNRSARRPHDGAVVWADVTDLVTLAELLQPTGQSHGRTPRHRVP